MNYDPDLLPDEIHPHLQNYLDDCADLIDDQVRYGTLMFGQVLDDPDHGEMTEIVIMLFRQMLHIMDGVSVLIRSGSFDSCRVLLRSFIEHRIQYSFLVQKDTRLHSMQYRYFNYRRELEWMKRIDGATVEGESFRKDLKMDPQFAGSIDLDSQSDAVSAYQQRLAQPDFQPFSQEYDRMVQAKRKPKHWYSLFDGPQNLCDLARATRMMVLYHMYYRRYSEHAHGNDILSGLTFNEDSMTILVPSLRQFNASAESLIKLAVSVLFPMYFETAKTFKSTHLRHLGEWFGNEINDRHARTMATTFSP